MSSYVMQAICLSCDGCSAELGNDGAFRSAIEARAAAYAAGWRFPPILVASGKQGTSTHDVCPACIGDWVPRMRERTSGRYRPVPPQA